MDAPERGQIDMLARLGFKQSALLPAIFFISPLATSVAFRLTPFFAAIIGLGLIGAALRLELPWRRLLPRRAALAACLLFAAYVFLNATWAVDPLAGIGKAALLMGLVLVTFAAIEAASALDERYFGPGSNCLCRRSHARRSFHPGGTWLLTHGIATRMVVSWLCPFLLLFSQKNFKISNGDSYRISACRSSTKTSIWRCFTFGPDYLPCSA